MRRERGLTSEGLFRYAMQWFNRMLLESGLRIGVWGLAAIAFFAGGAAFLGVMHFRESLMEAGGAALVAAILILLVAIALAGAAGALAQRLAEVAFEVNERTENIGETENQRRDQQGRSRRKARASLASRKGLLHHDRYRVSERRAAYRSCL